MSDDLIKRSDAIKSLDNAWINGTGLLDANEAIKQLNDLPPADRLQGKWIPCEERLPEADGLYLATFTLIGIPKFSNVESFKNGKWEYHNGYIIAWQPLPKPWSGKIKHKPKGADDGNK